MTSKLEELATKLADVDHRLRSIRQELHHYQALMESPRFDDPVALKIAEELRLFTSWHRQAYGEDSVKILPAGTQPEQREDWWERYETSIRWQGWLQRSKLGEL